MIIVSQNKKIIVNFDNVIAIEIIDTKIEDGKEIPADKFGIAVATNTGDFFIGVFNTKEKAQKVIDDIRTHSVENYQIPEDE